MELRKEGEGGDADESDGASVMTAGAVITWGQWPSFPPHASLPGFSGQATYSAFHEIHLLPITYEWVGPLGSTWKPSISPKPHLQPLGRMNG